MNPDVELQDIHVEKEVDCSLSDINMLPVYSLAQAGICSAKTQYNICFRTI